MNNFIGSKRMAFKINMFITKLFSFSYITFYIIISPFKPLIIWTFISSFPTFITEFCIIVRIFSSITNASSPLRPGRIIRNSSPPHLQTASARLILFRSICPVHLKTSSHISWQYTSFTSLKSSISIKIAVIYLLSFRWLSISFFKINSIYLRL